MTLNSDLSLTVAPTKADMLARSAFSMIYSTEVYWTEKNLSQSLSKSYDITYVDECNSASSGFADFTLQDMDTSVLRPVTQK